SASAPSLQWTLLPPVTENLYQTATTTGAAGVPFDAMPDLAVDQNGSTTSLYVTWTRFYPANELPDAGAATTGGGADVYLASSTDGGSSWQLSTQAIPGAPSALRETVSETVDPQNSGQIDLALQPSFTAKLTVTFPTVRATGSVAVGLSGAVAAH